MRPRAPGTLLSSIRLAAQWAIERGGPSVCCASRSIPARRSPSPNSASFSPSGSAISRSQPFRMSRMKPLLKLRALLH